MVGLACTPRFAVFLSVCLGVSFGLAVANSWTAFRINNNHMLAATMENARFEALPINVTARCKLTDGVSRELFVITEEVSASGEGQGNAERAASLLGRAFIQNLKDYMGSTENLLAYVFLLANWELCNELDETTGVMATMVYREGDDVWVASVGCAWIYSSTVTVNGIRNETVESHRVAHMVSNTLEMADAQRNGAEVISKKGKRWLTDGSGTATRLTRALGLSRFDGINPTPEILHYTLDQTHPCLAIITSTLTSKMAKEFSTSPLTTSHHIAGLAVGETECAAAWLQEGLKASEQSGMLVLWPQKGFDSTTHVGALKKQAKKKKKKEAADTWNSIPMEMLLPHQHRAPQLGNGPALPWVASLEELGEEPEINPVGTKRKK